MGSQDVKDAFIKARLPDRSRTKITLHFGFGAGQLHAPFPCTLADFLRLCSELDISDTILARIRRRETFFEHRFIYPRDSI